MTISTFAAVWLGVMHVVNITRATRAKGSGRGRDNLGRGIYDIVPGMSGAVLSELAELVCLKIRIKRHVKIG